MTREERAQIAQRRSVNAIGLMRTDGRTLTAAAAEAGTTPATVRRYAASALQREGRVYRVTKSDRLARRMSMFTTDGVRVVTVRGSNQAKVVSQHWNAVQAFQRGDRAALDRFVAKRAAGATFATDAATVKAYSQTGEAALDDIYAIPT